MTIALQKRLAWGGALLAALTVLGANIHLVTVAVRSQPACGIITPDRAPARPAC